jgi:hypothetical protein
MAYCFGRMMVWKISSLVSRSWPQRLSWVTRATFPIAFALSGCSENQTRYASIACTRSPIVGTDAEAIAIATRAAEVRNPDAFSFNVEKQTETSTYFVRIVDLSHPDDFFATVIVNACDGTAQVRGPL